MSFTVLQPAATSVSLLKCSKPATTPASTAKASATYFIEKDGQVFQTRDENEIGMHARHYNAHSIGICYEGGLDEKGRPADTRTPAQRAALIALLRSLKIDYPDAEIMGHCELEGVHKACPSFSCSEYRDYFEYIDMPN